MALKIKEVINHNVTSLEHLIQEDFLTGHP